MGDGKEVERDLTLTDVDLMAKVETRATVHMELYEFIMELVYGDKAFIKELPYDEKRKLLKEVESSLYKAMEFVRRVSLNRLLLGDSKYRSLLDKLMSMNMEQFRKLKVYIDGK